MIKYNCRYYVMGGSNRGEVLISNETALSDFKIHSFINENTGEEVLEYIDNLTELPPKEYIDYIFKPNHRTIKIKYFTDIIPLEQKENSDWVDLRSAIDIDLKQGEFKLIPLGVGMKLPEGYELNIVPRSSTFKNFKIIQTNHFAVVDESYCGDNDQIFYPVLAIENTHISKNDRICQFRINKKQPQLVFETVDKLEDEDRGGIGSTGIK